MSQMKEQPKRIPREDLVIRKNEVEQLLKHPLMEEFFNHQGVKLFEQWTQTGGVDDRERLWLVYQGIDALKDYFHKILVDGKYAEKELKDRQSK